MVKSIKQNSGVTAVKLNPVDNDTLFRYFNEFANSLEISAYYWNLGYECFQKINIDEQKNIKLTSHIEIDQNSRGKLHTQIPSSLRSPD